MSREQLEATIGGDCNPDADQHQNLRTDSQVMDASASRDSRAKENKDSNRCTDSPVMAKGGHGSV